MQLIENAIAHTTQLTALLETENSLLSASDKGDLEDIVKQKRHLAAKVEGLMSDIKQADLKQSPEARRYLPELETTLQMYQQTARKNVLLLQAAQQTTVDAINIFKEAVNRAKPQAKTYGASGQMSETNNPTRLIDKGI